ncbi:hypothetical protein [Aureivirga marina]|uniref:hypothetical protein n=1 Tax=Aureivirga marina TaxID=1182451 RepID=UPI0018C8DB57|nr:hypothetical protein [Aureivirga marina]
MSFIEHTINWTKGEIFEAMITGFGGILLLIFAFCFWKFGNTPNAKAMIIPLLLIGLLLSSAGGYNIYSNKNRIVEYQNQFKENPEKFIKAEKERVESFDTIFNYTFPFALIATILGAVLFFFFENSTIRAISFASILLGLLTYLIDFFAKERADIYFKAILEYLPN